RDGSEIREWVAPGTPGRRQSLAEATVPAGGSTVAHYHRESEEIYLVARGSGRLLLGSETREIAAGDCVVIPPGTVHRLWADGGADLVVVCSCVPPYSHEDTFLVADG
ncbi:MAG: cupin domain-containing protein, partial [Gemmatimonadota bacterium]|nr:cupin domain-containing protein [Gemmatimonadota bacterium]